MRNITKDILDNAKEYFSNFGFQEEQISSLLQKGERDIETLIDEVEEILSKSSIDLNLLNSKLHALKGLILQLGSTEIGNKINESRNSLDNSETIKRLKELLLD